MTSKFGFRIQMIAALCGVMFDLFYGVSWSVIGQNLPPASPALSAADLAAFYVLHHNAILLGNALACLFAAMWIPFTAQLALTMRPIEGDFPVLTIIQVIGGGITSWAFIFCPAIWAAAAYRPEADPMITQAMNDTGFFLFNLTYSATSLQAISAGIAGLMDKRATPVFPRWVAMWAIFTGFVFVPITLMPFFKTGPFAWDGLVTFWIGFAAFFVWAASMGGAMMREIRGRMRAAATS